MAIQQTWLKDLKNTKDKDKFKEVLLHSQGLFKTIIKIIEENIKQNNKDRLKKDMYSSPNWHLEQADLVGETRAYEKVIKLLRNSLT